MTAIRRSVSQDAPAISALVCSLADTLLVDRQSDEAKSFFEVMEPARVAKNMEKADRFYLVAESEGQVVGMILVVNNNYIGQFFVNAANQGKGIGAALWKEALSISKSASAGGTFTVKSSIAAVPVYTRLGFKTTGAAATDSGFHYVPMRHDGAA
jgi:predicted GNAT family N-acyltransferase